MVTPVGFGEPSDENCTLGNILEAPWPPPVQIAITGAG